MSNLSTDCWHDGSLVAVVHVNHKSRTAIGFQTPDYDGQLEQYYNQIEEFGFTILEGIHPIVPVMVGEAATAMDMSNQLLEQGVYVRGLWYPVVPKGEARLRVQISAAHEVEDLDRALTAFASVGKKLGVI